MGNFQHIHYQALLRWGIFIWQHFLDEDPAGNYMLKVIYTLTLYIECVTRMKLFLTSKYFYG